MSNTLPKVHRRDGRRPNAVYALVVVVSLLVIVIGVLLTSGDLFSDEPRTDAERDYQLLLEGAEQNPADPAVLMTLAETEWQLGKKDDALRHGQQAVGAANDAAGYRLRYAGLLLLNDDRAAARKLVEDELALKTPGDPEPYFLRAQINRAEKKYDDAVADMKSGLAMSPMAGDMIILYADILAEAGEKDAAVEQYRSALTFLPNDERAIDGLARLGVEAPSSTETTAHGAEDSDQ